MVENKKGDSTFEGLGDNDGGVQLEVKSALSSQLVSKLCNGSARGLKLELYQIQKLGVIKKIYRGWKMKILFFQLRIGLRRQVKVNSIINKPQLVVLT